MHVLPLEGNMEHTIEIPDQFNILLFIGLLFMISQGAGSLAVKLKLPRMIGYIVSGIVFGPFVLSWFSLELIEHDLVFFRDFALAMTAFSIGGALKFQSIKRLAPRIGWVTMCETSLASLMVFIIMGWVLGHINGHSHFAFIFALILGAVSVATAPAAILSLLDEYKGSGDYKTTVLGIVALDDVMAVFMYTVAIAVVGEVLGQSELNVLSIFKHTGTVLLLELGIGGGLGLMIAGVLPFFSHYRAMLGVLMGIIMLACGLCLSLSLSPLLTCMVLGFMITNVAQHDLANEAMGIIHTLQPPVFGVFFFMAGAHLDIALALPAIGFALILTVARFIGKYSGAFVGARLSGLSASHAHHLGMSLLPAAGVMMGLTMHARDNFGPLLGRDMNLLVCVVVGATVINELLTPFFVRYAIKHEKSSEDEH